MSARHRVEEALQNHGCRGRASSWQCPAHEDRAPSLSIGPRRDGNGVVLNCHAGCATEEVVSALGITLQDLFDEPLEKRERPQVVAEYPYCNEQGELLLTVKRLEPGYDGNRKTFRQYAADGTPKVTGIRRVLYRLPDVLAAAQAGGPVFIVEGEKDAETLAATGATATCNIGGAGKWNDSYTASLRGASEVIVIADRDEPGRKHAAAVADSVQRAGIPVRVLEPAKGKDVSDHLAAGLGYEDLVPLDGESSEEPPAAEEQEAAPLLGKLPATFYDQREILKRIRQYAHSMCCSADVVLYATMARLAGMINHNIKVDTGVKKPASLNLFVGIIDSSGSNKSTSNEASEDLLKAPDDRDFLDGIPIGTGEGIAEAMIGEREEDDFDNLDKNNNPKTVKVRKQVRHNLYFYIDEGEALIRIGSRDGSSLWPSIRSAWQAGTLGQTNATAERRRFIKRGTYAMGVVAGFQYTNALVVLRDSITGTAQRFVWCLAIDPDIPMDPVPIPDIDFGHPQNLQGITMTMPTEMKRKIRTELVLRNSGRLDIDPLDAHANLAKVKLAGLLALLDGARTDITMQDWELAEEMWAVSCTLRTAILERASREEATAARAKREERVQDAVQAHTAVVQADATLERRARWCVAKIRDGHRREELLRKARSDWRKEVPAALELALARGWLIEDDEGHLEVGGGAP